MIDIGSAKLELRGAGVRARVGLGLGTPLGLTGSGGGRLGLHVTGIDMFELPVQPYDESRHLTYRHTLPTGSG